MIWIYAAAAIFGGAFLIPMILGGFDSDVEVGGDGFGDGLGGGVDMDLDMDVDVDVDVGGPDLDLDGADASADGGGFGFDGAFGAVFASLVSFRTIVFFAAFFGAAGLVFSGLGYSSVVTAITATGIGGFAAVANSMLFGLIRSSQANSQISDRTLEGRPATVVLPLSGEQRGRVRIDLEDQPQYLVARSIEPRSSQRFDVGAPVVVVKIENGTALVASLAELDLGEES